MTDAQNSGAGTPVRIVVAVANLKGGVGKTLIAASLIGELAITEPWHLVEIEHRANMSQERYQHPPTVTLKSIPLFGIDDRSSLPDATVKPLDQLWDLIPARTDTVSDCRILVDFGASSFQSFVIWALDRKGLVPFRKARFKFVFFIPVQGSDEESAKFFNENAPVLRELGQIVLVKNLREGADFSLLDPKLAADFPSMTLRYSLEVSQELQQTHPAPHRLTFRQLADLDSASRRASMDAISFQEHITAQLTVLRPKLGI